MYLLGTEKAIRYFVSLTLTIGLSVAGLGTYATAGVITDEPAVSAPTKQPDAEKEEQNQEQDQPGRKHAHMHKQSMHLITDAASIIGIEPDALKKELKAGKSIAEVAKAKGIEEAVLTDRLIAMKMKKIDEAVKSGKWTAEKADKMKERLPDHVRHMLSHKGFHKKQEAEKKQ